MALSNAIPPIECFWLEDKAKTATDFKEVLELAGARISLSGSPDEFVGDLNSTVASRPSDLRRTLVLIDLKVYGPLPDVDSAPTSDDAVDLGFQVIERYVAHEQYGVKEAVRAILTEREKDDALVATAQQYGVPGERLFQKYVKEELMRFKEFVNGIARS